MSNKSPDFLGKTALVTGASRGIGAAVAKGLAAGGAHVVLLARTQGALEVVDDEIRAAGGSATLLPMDLARAGDEIAKIGPSLHERFGGLDIFVGNAGILGPLSPAHQIKMRDWERVMAVNFFANVRLIQSLDPLLRMSEAGRAVFTSSVLAMKPMAYWGPYVASKTAVNGFVKTYAQEVQQTNMRVNAADPGIVDTAMLDEAFPGGFPGEARDPKDVVAGFLNLCAPACASHGEIISL